VDDHLFFRIWKEFLPHYNEQHRLWHTNIKARGRHQDASRIWYGGHVFEDGTLEEFDEDCLFPIVDLSGFSPRLSEDSLFTYSFDDISRESEDLRIPWEQSKDAPFAYSNKYIGFIWNLSDGIVHLPEEKKEKYLHAIQTWQLHSAHVLIDVQSLYGKLRHTSLIVPQGWVYLTALESMLQLWADKPLLLRRPAKGLASNLLWWTTLLQQDFVGCAIPRPLPLHDPKAFSDASSSFGIAIVIGQYWRAWTLKPGWNTLNRERDIGWAEAVGFEFLIRYLIHLGEKERHFRVFGDNQASAN